jgi:hypothetical protein
MYILSGHQIDTISTDAQLAYLFRPLLYSSVVPSLQQNCKNIYKQMTIEALQQASSH